MGAKFWKKEDNYVLTDEDFYPPLDDRVLTSYIYDIENGDSFIEYTKQMFCLCDEEDYWEN